MLSSYSKHVQYVKIYLPCNFEVHHITHLGVIALFSSVFGEGVCNDEGYICYFLTEVIKFYWLMLLFYPCELYRLLWASSYNTSSLKQQSTGRHVAPLWHIIPIPSQPVVALSTCCCVLSGEAINTNLIVLGLTRPGLKSVIYRTRGEHAYHYATDAVHAH